MPKILMYTDTLDRIDKLLKSPNPLLNSGEVLESYIFDFFDGRYVEVQIISPLNPAEETCWLQACLFQDDLPDGSTRTLLDTSPVEDEIYSKHIFEYEDTRYIVDIRREI